MSNFAIEVPLKQEKLSDTKKEEGNQKQSKAIRDNFGVEAQLKQEEVSGTKEEGNRKQSKAIRDNFGVEAPLKEEKLPDTKEEENRKQSKAVRDNLVIEAPLKEEQLAGSTDHGNDVGRSNAAVRNNLELSERIWYFLRRFSRNPRETIYTNFRENKNPTIIIVGVLSFILVLTICIIVYSVASTSTNKTKIGPIALKLVTTEIPVPVSPVLTYLDEVCDEYHSRRPQVPKPAFGGETSKCPTIETDKLAKFDSPRRGRDDHGYGEANPDERSDGIKPYLYNLNIQFLTYKKWTGSLTLTFSVKCETNGTATRFFDVNWDLDNLYGWQLGGTNYQLRHHCSKLPVCLRKISVLNSDTLRFLVSDETPLIPGEYYDLTIEYFSGNCDSSMGVSVSDGVAMIVQSENTKVTWTHFKMRLARTVFPCLDRLDLKAHFQLQLGHHLGPFVTVKSSTPEFHSTTTKDPRSFSNQKNKQIVDKRIAFFPPTPRIPTYLFTFSLHRDMQTFTFHRESKKGKETNGGDGKTNSAKMVQINIHTVPEDNALMFNADSVFDTINSTIQWMEMITKVGSFEFGLVDFPMNKLDVFLLEPMGSLGVESMGSIYMRYSLYLRSRTVFHRKLIEKVVRHWVGNIFTVRYWNEICIAEGLSVYVSLLLSKEIHGEPIWTELQKLRFTNKSHTYSALKPMIKTSIPLITEFNVTDDIVDVCGARAPLLMAMMFDILSWFNAEGNDQHLDLYKAVHFVRILAEKYKFATAGLPEWKAEISHIVNNEGPGKLLETYLAQPGFPVLFARTTLSECSRQLFIHIEQKVHRFDRDRNQVLAPDAPIFTTPITYDICCIQNRRNLGTPRRLMTEKSIEIEVKMKDSHESCKAAESFYNTNETAFVWFILDPDSRFISRTLYHPENYAAIVEYFNYQEDERFKDSSAANLPLNLRYDQVQMVFYDFCYGMDHDLLPIPSDTDPAGSDKTRADWNELLDNLKVLSAKWFILDDSIGYGHRISDPIRRCKCCLKSGGRDMLIGSNIPLDWKPIHNEQITDCDKGFWKRHCAELKLLKVIQRN